jgi:alpha-beta hydrolase superfamily lysophospholipase
VYKDSVIDVLQRAGISVLTYDQQSLGDSDSVLPGTRCYFHKFDDLAIDLLAVHTHFASLLPPGTRIFWLGVSLGGGVAVRASQLRLQQPTPSPPMEGLLLMAPMISLTKVRQEYFFKPLGLRNQHLYGVMHQLSVRGREWRRALHRGSRRVWEKSGRAPFSHAEGAGGDVGGPNCV